MSRHSSDSFLPSGGIDYAGKSFSHLSSQTISPLSGVPRSFAPGDLISARKSTSQRTTPSPTAYTQSAPRHAHGQPLSPPKTRSPSAENTSAALIEDWRAYTAKLRSQNEGERAHMAADRLRMEEVMAEERQLWEQERNIFKAQIAELEAKLAESTGNRVVSPRSSIKGVTSAPSQSVTSAHSNAMSVGSIPETSSPSSVPQESGRDADGKPYYAPAPRNPSRSFEPSEMSALALGNLPAPKDSATRGSSKELTPADFVRSPPTDLDPIPENLPETIDISQIQPELEGVPLKASALSSPTFAPKATIPRHSPNKLSPSTVPPPRDVTNLNRSSSNAGDREKTGDVLVASSPENRRLTMHAGHTPNHSITKTSWQPGDEVGSGNETPRAGATDHLHRPSVAPGTGLASAAVPDTDEDGDAELSGPLGLTNDAAHDDPFLAALDEKLEQAKKSQPTSPSETSSCSSFQLVNSEPDAAVGDIEKDEGPTLRLKPSLNFGRPMGRW